MMDQPTIALPRAPTLVSPRRALAAGVALSSTTGREGATQQHPTWCSGPPHRSARLAVCLASCILHCFSKTSIAKKHSKEAEVRFSP